MLADVDFSLRGSETPGVSLAVQAKLRGDPDGGVSAAAQICSAD